MEAISHFRKLSWWPNLIIELIYFVKLQEVGVDTLFWKDERRGGFKINSYYNFLCVESKVLFPTRLILGS